MSPICLILAPIFYDYYCDVEPTFYQYTNLKHGLLDVIVGLNGPEMTLNTSKCVLKNFKKLQNCHFWVFFFNYDCQNFHFDLRHFEIVKMYPTNCLLPFQVDQIPQNWSENKCLILVPIFMTTFTTCILQTEFLLKLTTLIRSRRTPLNPAVELHCRFVELLVKLRLTPLNQYRVHWEYSEHRSSTAFNGFSFSSLLNSVELRLTLLNFFEYF